MCCDMRLRTIVTTLLKSGMCVGIEALSLKWGECDLEEGTITVACSKTASGLRTLPMTSRLKSELEKWRNAAASLSPYVFFNPLRPETHIRSVKKAWHRVLKLAESPPRLFISVGIICHPTRRSWDLRHRDRPVVGTFEEGCSEVLHRKSAGIPSGRDRCSG